MNYALVGSPDKITLSSFIRYFIMTLDGGLHTGELHYLMSEEAKDVFVEDFSSKNPKGIFSYYMKRPPVQDFEPIKYLPKKAIDLSEVIIWFDLYSTEPVLIKDSQGIMTPILTQWQTYLSRLG